MEVYRHDQEGDEGNYGNVFCTKVRRNFCPWFSSLITVIIEKV